VISGSNRQRSVLGVHVSAQLFAFVLTALGLTVLVAVAVFAWLERTA
jgi:hypothetical protein